MPTNDLADGRRPHHWLPAAGIAMVTPFLMWFAIGEYAGGPNYTFGPYEVGPESGLVTAGIAGTLALVVGASLLVP